MPLRLGRGRVGRRCVERRKGRAGLTLDTDVDVVLRLLGLSGILIGLGEGVEGLEILCT
jgi:hypothetical protein